MSYPFVQSYTDLGLRRGPILGFVVHMAEGGGTVGYLSRANPNGVSVHYVIEYSGRIVQMLRENHMHTSLRSSAIRPSDDADGLYGAKAARAVLGDWANITKTLGPNHATIAVEVEGFAANGPNVDQAPALARLVADVRQRNPTLRGVLGHRDFADYKACPGKRIVWSALGGHGLFTATEPEEPEVPGPDIIHFDPDVRGVIEVNDVPGGVSAIDTRGNFNPIGAGERWGIFGEAWMRSPIDARVYLFRRAPDSRIEFIKKDDCRIVQGPPAPPTPTTPGDETDLAPGLYRVR